ncbi:MAG TPA: PorV/PorQ family protein [Elusimicrobiota bacterium]|nr:PorV/PorQ family protein [Elusimicrobiota bacterium]
MNDSNFSPAWRQLAFIGAALLLTPVAWAASGTEGASFLDIPVGSQPAALGSAYTAQAFNAYATIWNPAGLGSLDAVEVAGTHVAYLQSIHYDFLGVAVPLCRHQEDGEDGNCLPRGFGASVQYLGSGDITAYNDQGVQNGSYSTSFAAYSLAYGQAISERLSLGFTGKAIRESLSDASASAYAADVGSLYKAGDGLYLGAAVSNIGTAVKFVSSSDPLPLAARVGTTWQAIPSLDLSGELVWRRTGLWSEHVGLEYRYQDVFSFRAGYDTTHIQELSASAGLTAGVGIFLWGQEFAYAWVPYSNLGNTHYFTLTLRFANSPSALRMKTVSAVPPPTKPLPPEREADYNALYQLLSGNETKALQNRGGTSEQEQP